MKTATSTSGYSALSFAVLLFLSFSVEVFAKRGCSAFGHSCFGGHGKRSNTNALENILPGNIVTNHENQEYDASRSDGKVLLTDSNRKFQDQQVSHSAELTLQARQRTDLYPLAFFISQWLASYRRVLDAELETNDK